MFIFIQIKTIAFDLNGNHNKINYHAMSKLAAMWNEKQRELDKEINMLDTILSTRMSNEETQGVLNFVQALHPNSSVRQIEEALVSFQNTYSD